MAMQLGVPLRPALVVTALATTIACEVPSITNPVRRPSAWQPDPASTLVYTSYSAIASAERLLISDSTTWREAWERLHSTRSPRPPLPIVDFRREAVILAALGFRGTGGFAIRIDSLVTLDRETPKRPG